MEQQDQGHQAAPSGDVPSAATTNAQYRIVNSDTGRRLMDYASRAHADAWLKTHGEYRVYSQHTDSTEMELYAIYVEEQSRHAMSVEG